MSQPISSQLNQNPFLEFYQKWCEKTPYVTRTIVIIILVEYIISFFTTVDIWFSNIPKYTIFSVELYRIIISPFVGNSILTLIILLLSYPTLGSKMEWSMGSSAYLFMIIAYSLITNIIFDVCCVLLYLNGTPDALYYTCQGFWTILFSLITIECMRAPELPRRIMFIPVDIPSKYMPIVMYLFFSLFGGLSLSYAIAIVVGYVSTLGYFDTLKPSSSYLEELESSGGGCLHQISSRSSGWVLASTSQGSDSWLPLHTATAATSPTTSQDMSNNAFWNNSNTTSIANQETEKNVKIILYMHIHTFKIKSSICYKIFICYYK